MIASQYGYTFDQFLEMTMRQVHACLERIKVRTHNDHALTAGFHGIEIELKQIEQSIDDVEAFSQEQKDVMKKQIADSLNKKVEQKKRI